MCKFYVKIRKIVDVIRRIVGGLPKGGRVIEFPHRIRSKAVECDRATGFAERQSIVAEDAATAAERLLYSLGIAD